MRRKTILAVLFGASLTTLTCTPVANDNRSAVVLTIALGEGSTSTGKLGDESASISSGSGFSSDVVNDAGVPVDDFLDFAITSILKNNTVEISEFFTVQLESYRISFTRPDGNNEPGVGVPFPLTLPVGGVIQPGNSITANLLVIPQEMKVESPLRDLWFGDGERIFAAVHIEIFGHDLVENAISADGSALVVFGDFPG